MRAQVIAVHPGLQRLVEILGVKSPLLVVFRSIGRDGVERDGWLWNGSTALSLSPTERQALARETRALEGSDA